MEVGYKLIFSTFIILLLVLLVAADNGVFDDTNYNGNTIYNISEINATTFIDVPKVIINKTANMCIMQNGTDIIITNNVTGVTC